MKTWKTAGWAMAGMAVMFGVGFTWRDLQRGSVPDAQAVTTLLGAPVNGKQVAAQDLVKETYRKIYREYVTDVKADDLKYAALQGAMSSLGDPHTVFLEPETNREFRLETAGNFVGIGARLASDPTGARVEVVFDDSPAWRAGLRPGDLITHVNGEAQAGREVSEIVTKIRGKEGTTVRLTLLRKGQAAPLEITPRRAKIQTPTVEGAMIPGTKIGRLLISGFTEPTTEQFDRELAKLEKQGIEGLVFDVRSNPGGLLETAVELLSRFQSNKVVVRMKGRNGAEQVARTFVGLARPWKVPMVVLMNEESASAAEIFAGCLRDYGMATLVGEHSYGKSTVQNVIPLKDESGAKITVARYYLPVTNDISRKVDEYGTYLSGGLQPDVKVELDAEGDVIFGDIKTDNQLKKAVEVLQTKTKR